ncbi:PHB depolymerase family esterase [Blastomonas sp. AAP53]|uniref:extracellular catalytic domain type 1 short-chain-length polyhydroxyalkanoate depolymerase n=1 Tax=Blastomonas sp. AAP53 TaxID=1248760 RepID=UPI0002DF2F5A|nr:PHB depolymerase family esterase [Blastomonas sp. AAP53]
MAKALRLTRAGHLGAATRLIQSTLMQATSARSARRGMTHVTDSFAMVDALSRFLPMNPFALAAPEPKTKPKPKTGRKPKIAGKSRPAVKPKTVRASETRPSAAGSFTERHFRGSEGTLDYWLYLPARPARGLPLVVMMHGCTQTPCDFARGTGMNLLAEEIGFVVAYPSQPASANIARCWNWFKPGDQRRGSGEPAAIAALTRAIIAEHETDASRVYVAGLSAGGAAAAILGAAYPDIYAAIGVHSGLACGAATDMMSAFSAMRNGSLQTHGRRREGRFVPVITFHGDQDSKVHAINSAQIVANAAEQIETPLAITHQRGETAAGRAYTRELNSSADGAVQIEQWTIHGAGHAWSGGSADGTYTDASGPDASRAMFAFFQAHRIA